MIEFSPGKPGLPADAGATLLAIARDALLRHFGRAGLPWTDGSWLAAPAATFVTLEQGGELRGCIGTTEALRPLRVDIAVNCVAAAVRDDRFPPLSVSELDSTSIGVSLLSLPEHRPAASEDEAAALLRPGIDGVILSAGGRCGTYLPQVWDHFADPVLFLRALRRKAGLPDGWSREMRLSTYEVVHWREQAT